MRLFQLLGLAPLLVFVGAIAAVVLFIRGRSASKGSGAAELGMGTVRRLYSYTVSCAALMLAANGVALLVRSVIDRAVPGRTIAGDLTTQTSLGLALAIVGTPLWLAHWAYIQRQVAAEPQETSSTLRKLYIYLVLFVGMVFLAVGTVALLQWALGSEPALPAYRLGSLAVWACLWLYHWRLEAREGQPTPDTQTLRRWYVYLTVAYSLWMVAAGAGVLANAVLQRLYDGLFSVPVLAIGRAPLWSNAMRTAAAVSLVGSGVWLWHWLRVARGDTQSLLRQVYLNIFAILPGILTLLAAVALVLFATFSWLLGAAKEPAAVHFKVLPGALASLAVGLALTGYHWSLLQQESRQVAARLLAARRSYIYIMAGLGLGALAVAAVILSGTALEALAGSGRSILTGPRWWRAPLAAALTLLAVGTPLYWYYWALRQRKMSVLGREEAAALARRIMVYAVLGISMLSLLGGASHLLFVLLRGLLRGSISLTVLRDARWSIGIAATTAAILPYYWRVLRQDQQASGKAEEQAPRKAVTVVTGATAGQAASQLEAALGQRVQAIRALEAQPSPELDAERLAEIARQVATAPGQNVLVLLLDGQVRVLSHD